MSADEQDRPMAAEHRWKYQDLEIKVSAESGGWDGRRDGAEKWIGRGGETLIESRMKDEILRLRAERDEALAKVDLLFEANGKLGLQVQEYGEFINERGEELARYKALAGRAYAVVHDYGSPIPCRSCHGLNHTEKCELMAVRNDPDGQRAAEEWAALKAELEEANADITGLTIGQISALHGAEQRGREDGIREGREQAGKLAEGMAKGDRPPALAEAIRVLCEDEPAEAHEHTASAGLGYTFALRELARRLVESPESSTGRIKLGPPLDQPERLHCSCGCDHFKINLEAPFHPNERATQNSVECERCHEIYALTVTEPAPAVEPGEGEQRGESREAFERDRMGETGDRLRDRSLAEPEGGQP